jgi:hypothetical protein
MVKRNNNNGRQHNGRRSTEGPLGNPRAAPRERNFATEMHGFIGTIDISSSSGVFAAQQFSLANFANYATIAGVFDQYRIREITIEFIPQMVTSFINAGTVATVVPTSVYNHNVLATCVDTDDSTAPANEAVVLGHESGVLHGPLIRTYKRTFKPAVSLSVYQGAFTGYANMQDQWIDSVSTGVQHYGIKYAISHGTNTATGNVLMCVYAHALVDYRKKF